MGYGLFWPKLSKTTLIFWVLFILFIPIITKFNNIPIILALNKVNNWDFNGSSTGWSATNDNGLEACGTNTSSTADNAYSTFAYNSGTFRAITATSKNANYRGYISQSITIPGSGTVKAKGAFTYDSSSTSWGVANTSWIRLDLFDSTNTTFVAALQCVSFNTNQASTNTGFGSDVNLTGGTTYTIRLTMRNRLGSTNNSTATTNVDNVIVNVAPTGLSVSSVTDSTNTSLSWTASTAGTGANTLNSSTPYKVYRKTSAGVTVSDFLANASTNSYTDSSTTGNSSYYYAVSDVDTASLESPLSAESSILTRPGAPTSLSFSNVSPYAQRVSWTAPTGGASSYKVESCDGTGCSDYTQIASGVTNTYYDDSGLTAATVYRYRVRATNATGDGPYSTAAENSTSTVVVSVSITSDGTVAYGNMALNSTKNTTSGDLNDTQTARNDGNVTENFNIKTSNAVGGTGWTLGSDPGSNTFVHYFSINGGGAWTKFTTADSYQTLVTGIGVSSSQNFDLQINTPTVSSDGYQKSITVTIQAVQ